MRFNSINCVILFGGSPLLLAIAKDLRQRGIKTLIYTAPRQVVEVIDESRITLGEALSGAGFSFVVSEDINEEPGLRVSISSSTLGLGLGEAWSFSPEIIDLFDGRLLDFMGIPLPEYRGGAHYTWLILKRGKCWGSALQVINAEMRQGEFDSGEIVKSRQYEFPSSARIPIDFFNAAIPQEVQFLREFLNEVEAGKDFELKRPDEARSLFFLRLNTLVHGWIDWSMSGEDIETFICAFDAPYKGASTRIGGTRVHLKGALLDGRAGKFHPFQSGLIVRISPTRAVTIVTRDGLLLVDSVTDSDGEPFSGLRVGDRLFTERRDLEAALDCRVSYGV